MVFLFSCGTKPIKEGTYEKAAWETKAQLKNLKDGKVHNVSIDVYAIKNDKIRIEATGTLGFKVASIVIDREKVQAILPTEKKFYQGPATQEAITRVLKIPLHPSVLFAIIFDQGLRGGSWTCAPDEQGLVKQCQNKDLIFVEWERLENPKKMVRIKTKSMEVEWFFKDVDVDWKPKAEIFQLSAPEGYQVMNLR